MTSHTTTGGCGVLARYDCQIRGLVPVVFLLALLLVPGGCATGAGIDEAVPQSAASTQAVSSDESDAPATPDGAPEAENAETASEKTGADGFPNLNVRPQAAREQITEDEKAESMAELKAAKAGQEKRGSGGGAAETQRLRKLARTHAEEALEEIEAE